MAITITCPSCSQLWAVVPGIKRAHPGHTTPPVMVEVPREDIYGNRLGGHDRIPSSRWISDGPSATLDYQDVGGPENAYAWSCLCGQALEYRVPAVDVVACQHGTTEVTRGKGCRVYRDTINPPSDFHINPRHGMACPCCGHQGTHRVRRDRKENVPACLTP